MDRSSRSALLIIFVTVFIDLLGFGIVLPLLARYAEAFEAEGLTIGLLLASFSAMQFLFAPLWGRLSDRVGRRPILILGLAGSCGFYALFGIATSLGRDGTLLGLGTMTWLFISRIGAGIAGATIPTAQAYIADTTGTSERARGMALIGAAFGIGFAFGPLIGAAFVSDQPGAPPSPAPGFVAAALSGIALLAAIFKLPESLRPDSASAGRSWLSLKALRVAGGRPVIGLIMASIFVTTFAFGQFESTLALLTEALGLSQQDNFLVFSYIGFVLALAQGLLVRRLVPRVGEYVMCVAGVALMVVGLLLIGLAGERESLGLLYGVLPITVIGFASVTPSLQALLSLNSVESGQGQILGLGQSMAALARILGPVAGMLLYERGVSQPYWWGAGVMAASLLLVIPLRGTGSRSQPEEPTEEALPVSTEM